MYLRVKATNHSGKTITRIKRQQNKAEKKAKGNEQQCRCKSISKQTANQK